MTDDIKKDRDSGDVFPGVKIIKSFHDIFH